MTNEPFDTPIIYKDVSVAAGKFKIELLIDLIYTDIRLGKITVPKGFMCDLASIPGPVQNIISKVGPYDGAAIIHDWLYCIQIFDRCTVDNIFLRLMKLSGVGFLTRYTMFWAVRMFAGPAWEISKKDVGVYRRLMK